MDQADLIVAAPTAVVEQPKRKKVAVLGFTQSYRLAPFNDPEWEIWGLNELYMFIPRWDRWFEIHRREIYEADKKRVSDHVERLKAMTCPIYMQQHWEDIPGSVVYPLEDMIARFGNYFTNTISYMVALAIMEGFEEIGVYGVDMAHDTEYGTQRPSCEYIIGWAMGAGIKVTIPYESDLLKANFLYGYQEAEEQAFHKKLAARERELNQKQAEIDQQIAQLTEARAQYRGAIQDCQHVRKIWSPSANLTMGKPPGG